MEFSGLYQMLSDFIRVQILFPGSFIHGEDRMRKFYRFLRVLSAITLFFFCWTFLPLWQAVA